MLGPATVRLMTPKPPVYWPAGFLLGADAGAVVAGLPICVRLKTFVKSARIWRANLSLKWNVPRRLMCSEGRRAERKSSYKDPVPGPKLPFAGLAHALGLRTTSWYGLMQPQFRFLRYRGWPVTRNCSLPPM